MIFAICNGSSKAVFEIDNAVSQGDLLQSEFLFGVGLLGGGRVQPGDTLAALKHP